MRHFLLATTLALATAALPLAAHAAPGKLDKTDMAFMKKAAQGGMTEVMEGQSATTAATSPDVKSFAQKMVDDHTANNQELATLASSKGVDLPTTLDKKHQKQVDMLDKKTGAGFEKSYVSDQKKDHESMLKLMQNEADHGTDADVKAFAAKTMTAVQEHISMLKAIKS